MNKNATPAEINTNDFQLGFKTQSGHQNSLPILKQPVLIFYCPQP